MVATAKTEARVVSALDMECDELEARLTVPVADVGSRLRLVSNATAPAIDRGLWRLHLRFAREHRRADRDALVAHYGDHARALARRFYRSREPLDDLQQVAVEGLLRALERFDPSRGMPFLAYANPTIVGCLKRHYRDAGWAIRVPRRVHELSKPIRDAWDSLSQDLGRTPTAAEVADLMGVAPGIVDAALAAEAVRASGSLEAPVHAEGGSLERSIGADDRDLERAENRHALRQSLSLLTDEDVSLLRSYFEDGKTQAEIAAAIGVSQMQVSRNLARIIKRLRSHMPLG
jgi:RNA polymerase sigma-B factor